MIGRGVLVAVGVLLWGLGLAGCFGELALEPVARGLRAPVYVTSAPGAAGRLFALEQNRGLVRVVEDGAVLGTPFLDLGDKVFAGGLEQGLLGLAFHPDYAENGRFYVNYTSRGAGGTVFTVFTVFEEYLVSADPRVADGDSGRVVLSFQQPDAIHNGGMLAFGPEGHLYIATGDGGPANDPDNRAQALDSFLGKILRIDVDGGSPYAVPPDNPFVDTPGALGEIWAYGLRNPWRFSFDRETGDLYIGDVGERAREEINVIPAGSGGGQNFGWRVREGTICRPGERDCALPGAVDPIYEYDKLLTASVTGGYVYRGSALPGWQGAYFFADFTTGQVWTFRRDGAGIRDLMVQRGLRPPRLVPTIASFGEDADGELYLVDYLSGGIYKIVAR